MRTILQTWHSPRTVCTSSAISPAHLMLAAGSGEVAPDSLTTLNEVEVSAASPYCASNVLSSDRTFGSLNASTIATSWPVAVVDAGSTPYAVARSLGV